MGTRSLTYIIDENGDNVICIYRQFDGYLRGMGKALKEFVSDGKVVNGLSGDEDKVFNGVGCFAAQLVKHLKERPGNVYLFPAVNDRDDWQDYEYRIYFNTEASSGFYTGPADQLRLAVKRCHDNRCIYSGTFADFEPGKDEERYEGGF